MAAPATTLRMPSPARAGERTHWDNVYQHKASAELSWYEDLPRPSLALIAEADPPYNAAIVDVGGGDSRLAGLLVAAGFTDLTVVDISRAALRRAKRDAGDAAETVRWVQADIRKTEPVRRYDLWHDRAVFHFMVDDADRARYLGALRRGLRRGGHLVIATFGAEGPTRCSGLPARRYSIDELVDLLPDFSLVAAHLHDHHTPSGRTQQFVYTHFQRS